jgi:8-oxo-dGTP pyrophosphatase MutT (NUDIX family)
MQSSGQSVGPGKPWRLRILDVVDILNSHQVHANPWLTVRQDEVRRPDGTTGSYCVVEAADIALVVPLDGDRVHLVEQYRHPVGGWCWEFPSGSTDEDFDSDPAGVAARELREETGLVPGELVPLGTLAVHPSTLDQRCHVFLATDLTEGPMQREVAEQDMRSAWFTLTEVGQMIRDGGITDAKSLAAYALLVVTGAGRSVDGHTEGVISKSDFVARLGAAVPEADSVVAEHLADNDELLLHLLMSDLLRLVVSTFAPGQLDVTDRLLAFVDQCLRDGDDYVANAVVVSFVEDFGVFPGESDALLERWPAALRAEHDRGERAGL